METSNLEGWDKDVRYFKISNCDDSSDKDSDSDSETQKLKPRTSLEPNLNPQGILILMKNLLKI